MNDYKFELLQRVCIIESNETGSVIGRASYVHAENCYLVRYKSNDGRAVETWWGESALEQA